MRGPRIKIGGWLGAEEDELGEGFEDAARESVSEAEEDGEARESRKSAGRSGR